MERFRTITQIYNYKVQRLMGKTNDPDCLNLLNEGRRMLNTFLSVNSKSEFYNYFEKIERQNRGLREKSCSTIY
jgi:type III secretory pathway component EscR